MYKLKIITIMCMLTILIACGGGSSGGGGSKGPTDNFETNPQPINPALNAVVITYNSSGVTVDNPFADNGVAVDNTTSHIVVTSTNTTNTINYVLTGTNNDASFKIDNKSAAFSLYLNGVDIAASDGPAINIQSSKDATIHLVNLTNNRLVDGAAYATPREGEKTKGTLYSAGSMIIEDGGTLIVRNIGEDKHAIASDKGSLTIKNGNIQIKESVKDGLNISKDVIISGGSLNIRSTEDGIQSDANVSITGGSVDIASSGSGDGIKNGKAVNYINISDASVTVSVVGLTAKGITSKGDINLTNAAINVTTSGGAIFEYAKDDPDPLHGDTSSASCIKSDGNMVVNGGTITLKSTGEGGKGINVKNELAINGGNIDVLTTGKEFKFTDSTYYSTPTTCYESTDNVNMNTMMCTAGKGIKSDGNLTVTDANVRIKTSHDKAEGLESKATVAIKGNTVLEIDAYDDGINAGTMVDISGNAKVYAYSADNDGIDSNGDVSISGNALVIGIGKTQGDSGINNRQVLGADFIVKDNAVVIGTGASTGYPNVGNRYVVYSVTNVAANTAIRMDKASGGEILTFVVPRSYGSMVMLMSTSGIANNTNYTIRTGGAVTGGTGFHGYYTGSNYSGGTQKFFTTENVGLGTVVN